MSYRIDFTLGGGVLRAVVSGRSAFAGAIAREIGEQARQSSVRHVLIDARRLRDNDRYYDEREALSWLQSPRR
jgi:hypothetical protein